MKDLILKILREETGQIDEVGVTDHFDDRKEQRYDSVSHYDVRINNTSEIVGKYYVRPTERGVIDNKISRIEGFKVPYNVSVAVPMYVFNPTIENVTFNGKNYKERSQNRQKMIDNPDVSLVSPENSAISGKFLTLFIARRKIQTLYLIPKLEFWRLLNQMEIHSPGNKHTVVRNIDKFDEDVQNAKTIPEWRESYLKLKNDEKETATPTQDTKNPQPEPDLEKEKKKLHYLKSLNKNKR